MYEDAVLKDDTAAVILLVGRLLLAVIVFDFLLSLLEPWYFTVSSTAENGH
jgi:hypothetical protein